jgi:hypothetical protein
MNIKQEEDGMKPSPTFQTQPLWTAICVICIKNEKEKTKLQLLSPTISSLFNLMEN